MDKERYQNGLGNLKLMIQRASTKYANEFVWQDVNLTDEFKNAYTAYLGKTNYEIEFFDSTAVITSPLNKYIFVPNQWFVIASYAVEIYTELNFYKDCFKSIAADRGKKPDAYAKALRDDVSSGEKLLFVESAKYVLKSRICPEKIDDACEKLWRFVSDYSWWSGQKTIDRGDFFVSVILNMLNLVNASQGYVADIVNAYGSDFHLRTLVKSIDAFTVDLACNIIRGNNDYEISAITNTVEPVAVDKTKKLGESEKPKRIKINLNNTREIKY